MKNKMFCNNTNVRDREEMIGKSMRNIVVTVAKHDYG
jgi:hypothetical protein